MLNLPGRVTGSSGEVPCRRFLDDTTIGGLPVRHMTCQPLAFSRGTFKESNLRLVTLDQNSASCTSSGGWSAYREDLTMIMIRTRGCVTQPHQYPASSISCRFTCHFHAIPCYWQQSPRETRHGKRRSTSAHITGNWRGISTFRGVSRPNLRPWQNG